MPKQMHRSIKEKVSILEEWEQRKGNTSLRRFAASKGINHCSLSGWINKRDELYQQVSASPISRVRFRLSDYKGIDDCLLKYFRLAQAANVVLTGPSLRTKAESYATSLGYVGWKCSDGWFNRWKKRHNITLRRILETANSEDASVANGFPDNSIVYVDTFAVKAEPFTISSTELVQ